MPSWHVFYINLESLKLCKQVWVGQMKCKSKKQIPYKKIKTAQDFPVKFFPQKTFWIYQYRQRAQEQIQNI